MCSTTASHQFIQRIASVGSNSPPAWRRRNHRQGSPGSGESSGGASAGPGRGSGRDRSARSAQNWRTASIRSRYQTFSSAGASDTAASAPTTAKGAS